MSTLYYDSETYSPVPIKRGTYRYAEEVEVMLVSWAVGDGDVHVVDLTTPDKGLDDLIRALASAHQVVAHKSNFDRVVLRDSGPGAYPLAVKRLQAVQPPIERWHCTMTQALCHGLPGGLDALCGILGVDTDKAKDKRGKALIRLFCSPRSDGSRATRLTHPAEWAEFKEYAKQDIVAMREVHRKLPKWNYQGAEKDLWYLDQKINDRGFQIDLDLVDAAIAAVAKEKKRLDARTQEATGFDAEAGTGVGSTNQRDLLLAYILAEHGVELPDMKGDTLERRLADEELPSGVRELLQIRLSASTTSTAKYAAVKRSVSADGRLRGTTQFAGAARTRRWGGRLFQPHNQPRLDLPQAAINAGIEALKLGVHDLVVPDLMRLLKNAVRGVIIARPKHKLLVADLANIEGRKIAWLAKQEWKLQAFRDYDAGVGPDLYKLAYAKAFDSFVDQVSKSQRQVGKVMELFLGYEGGVGAFVTGAASYGVDLDDMAEHAWPTLPERARQEAVDFLQRTKEQNRPTFGLPDKTFIACDALKRMWRGAHDNYPEQWKGLLHAAYCATLVPCETYEAGRLKARRDGNWLRIGMPSGNVLCYPSPRVSESGSLSYLGMNQYTKKWGRIGTYGGKLIENATQSLARDVLAANMPRIEAAGYPIVLHVHDEIVCEVPDTSDYSSDELAQMMSVVPPWAKGLPLAAAGFETDRYTKE